MLLVRRPPDDRDRPRPAGDVRETIEGGDQPFEARLSLGTHAHTPTQPPIQTPAHIGAKVWDQGERGNIVFLFSPESPDSFN